MPVDPVAELNARFPRLKFAQPTGRWMNGARSTTAPKKRKPAPWKAISQFNMGAAAYENDEPLDTTKPSDWQAGYRHAQTNIESR